MSTTTSTVTASPLFQSLNAGAASSSPSNSASSSSSNNTLTQANFLQLLVAQLQNQDPLNPMSPTDFMSQLAQLSTVQGIQQMNTNFSSMLLMQGLTQGTNLIGKNVIYTKPNSTQTTQGVVQSVSVAGGNVSLVIGGNTIPLSQVQGISAGKTGS